MIFTISVTAAVKSELYAVNLLISNGDIYHVRPDSSDRSAHHAAFTH